MTQSHDVDLWDTRTIVLRTDNRRTISYTDGLQQRLLAISCGLRVESALV